LLQTAPHYADILSTSHDVPGPTASLFFLLLTVLATVSDTTHMYSSNQCDTDQMDCSNALESNTDNSHNDYFLVISENWAKIKKEKITTDYKRQYDMHTFMGKKQYYTIPAFK